MRLQLFEFCSRDLPGPSNILSGLGATRTFQTACEGHAYTHLLGTPRVRYPGSPTRICRRISARTSGLRKPSVVNVSQVLTIDKHYLVRPVCWQFLFRNSVQQLI